MPRHGYGKNTDLLNAVRDCIIRRLTYKEAVEELCQKGFMVNEKKYQRIKCFIQERLPERLDNIPHYEYPVSTIDSIDTINALENFLKRKLVSAKEDWLQLQIIGMILHCLVTREKFFDSSHVVASISKKLKKKNGDIQKKGQ